MVAIGHDPRAFSLIQLLIKPTKIDIKWQSKRFKLTSELLAGVDNLASFELVLHSSWSVENNLAVLLKLVVSLDESAFLKTCPAALTTAASVE